MTVGLQAAEAGNFVDGELSVGPNVSVSRSPADGSALGSYTDADEAQVHRALSGACRAFGETDWASDRQLRHKVLNQLADRIETRSPELAKMLARENGKLVGEAQGEVGGAPATLRYCAALALTSTGRAAEVRAGLHMSSVPEPVGVAGVIVPWNSPVILSVRSFAPALAAGCTAVVKMPSQTALVNGILHEIYADTPGLPPGVLSSLTESGDLLARELVTSPLVGALSYTGSTRVGREIMAGAAPTLKRVLLELGGKTPMIVFDDADLDRAVPVLTKGVTVFAGQFCMTGSRILVQRGVSGRLRERLAAALDAVVAGPGDDLSSDIGPMIDAASAGRVDEFVRRAIDAGAKPLVRGGLIVAGGAFYRPSLLEVDNVESEIVQEEVFGPVATFEVFDTEDEAVALANGTRYGLSAAVWTRDVDRPLRVARGLKAGTVWTNSWVVMADQFEEGGFKQSGLGRLRGPRALEEFQEYKTYVHPV
ncbi:aldehyde dehydrogenase family protein [Pseudarthrobacter sp. IC2-21]|jgi:acyl-CoA reductase-like NAD-dependent aldehyde dehydrogenase|uniref:aldehyde dehydrogenase family protein n=1 Tax=Pseudarthrobacter sp. IC2-21 TaxID=3092262 RepID=UPI002A6B7112|nr:aldehyde dehydrogenase family protein [Pseudarthrobacter sp. IC2-21]